MSFVKVYIHFAWSTKNRYPFLRTKELRQAVWKHIKENSLKKGIFIDYVNGYTDHCHCLVSICADQTIETVAKLIKGESSFWINRQEEFQACLRGDKFAWQSEYYAVSVSESRIEAVRNYIRNQEEHHKKRSFQEEYDEFMEKHGFQKGLG